MQVYDSSARYGAVTRLLHWGIALLMIWQLLGMVTKVVLGRESGLASMMVGTHQSLGFVLFVLILLRVVWALVNTGRRPAHGAGLMGLAAKAGHLALYVLMVFVPAVGLIRAWGNERAYNVFGWEVFVPRPEGQAVTWAVNLGNDWHGEIGWLLGALILGHIAAVLWHRLVLRDDTMAKMAG
ncbi:MAG: cytochrome b [Paracoccus sp. (in: a-proteobacteria)]|uniref:cytochrome b n=1 Tax=Paracoccus sp. TaxID=267 RepID=UPI0026E0DCAC|nr:cytochrome b [Paracoccus sp. (in: a-proteobacteria)]MDO5621887.1 cytochrome b [Paracoccus sp. (in: a-proteobacteria)]